MKMTKRKLDLLGLDRDGKGGAKDTFGDYGKK
jgi:hypothetical protein